MNTYLDCIPCFLKQALFAARAATNDDKRIKEVLDRVARLTPSIPLGNPPPETARLVYGAVREVTGVEDPFKAHKEKSIQKALSLYDELKSLVKNSKDPLHTAVRVAIAGNVIDLGVNQAFDLEAEMKDLLQRRLSARHYRCFTQNLEKARTVLYLGDNAGETVFDRILIEALGRDTVYAVREVPIINDATFEDAEKSGISEVARIVSSGCDAPGTILKRCSPEFLESYNNSDLIISKGQGNFESLSEEKGPVFFLFKVKCPVIAGHIGVDIGEMILKDVRLPGYRSFEDRGNDES
ncbi:MAG: damage-control phosphatase ARMT1 family protein [Desulfobacteraceae bacterium]